MQGYWLTILIFLPTIGSALVLATRSPMAARWLTLGTTMATFFLSIALLIGFHWSQAGPYDYARYTADGSIIPGSGVVQMVQQCEWIPAFNAQYKVGLDGLNYPLVVLTTFITGLVVLTSWNITRQIKGYMALLLLLETGVLGTFLSLDFLLFYVFFEVSLLPMYFLIGIWGGPRKEYAAIKFFLYTLVGSVGLLIALIGTYLYSRSVPGLPNGTLDLVKLASPAVREALIRAGLAGGVAKAFFGLAMLAFLIKLPAVPVHTWLPDAHVEAPTAISMVLAALLLKMGGYGIFRIAYPLFPSVALQWWWIIAAIGVVSILYGALCAMAQTDFKKLVAYSSVSHMGFVTLGAAMMTPMAANGAQFMMISHGITSAMMFFVVGVLYDRAHHRDLHRMGGLATTMPVYTGFSMIASFANLGLPGLCGFIGEIMVLLGSFAAARSGSILTAHGASVATIWLFAIGGCVGVVLSAAYMLWTVQRVFFGRVRDEQAEFPEIHRGEIAVLLPLATMAVMLGIFPTLLFFTFSAATVAAMFQLFG